MSWDRLVWLWAGFLLVLGGWLLCKCLLWWFGYCYRCGERYARRSGE